MLMYIICKDKILLVYLFIVGNLDQMTQRLHDTSWSNESCAALNFYFSVPYVLRILLLLSAC